MEEEKTNNLQHIGDFFQGFAQIARLYFFQASLWALKLSDHLL
jgi:hypothetical protein